MSRWSFARWFREMGETADRAICWDRPAQSKSKQERPRCELDGRMMEAYQAGYRILRGPIPEGLVLDHLCQNPRCLNPWHLEPVTQKVNLLRSPNTIPGKNSRKQTCPNGHPYDYTAPDGQRQCTQCRYERATPSYRRGRYKKRS